MCVKMEEKEEKRICEACAKVFEVNDFNRCAPFAMCDDCYDSYIVAFFESKEHEF